MYQQVLWVTSHLLLLSILLTVVYSEDSNMSYLLHVENATADSGSNLANEVVIDVDYDALEASI